jgi:hypothetical protein
MTRIPTVRCPLWSMWRVNWTVAAGTAIGLGAIASGLAHLRPTNALSRSQVSAARDT